MTTNTPQPMAVRRGGAKRGDHGTYIAPTTPDVSEPSDRIGTDTVPADAVDVPADTTATRGRRRVTPTANDTAQRAKAAYDAKPKVIFRAVDADTVDRLRAMYKDQLHKPGGVEGWSEWGRSLLGDVVDQYEKANGPLPTGQDVQLRPGRVAGSL